MKTIHFSILNYYTFILGTECITLGILFHNLDTDERIFAKTTKFDRVKMFDDDLDITFIKTYLAGIESEVKKNALNQNVRFSLEEFTRYYVNELRFEGVHEHTTPDADDFIEKTKKIYLKSNYSKGERLSQEDKTKYIKDILRGQNINYSVKKVPGKYTHDKIQYDYVIDKYAFKVFSFEGKDPQRLMNTAKSWSWNARAKQDEIKTIFVYDKLLETDKVFEDVIRILKENAYAVMQLEEAIDFAMTIKHKI